MELLPELRAKNDEIIGGIAGERAKKREEKITKCKKYKIL